jgi:hypothetical protein
VPESHTEDLRNKKLRSNAKKLPTMEVVDPESKYSPNLSCFHCISAKKSENQCDIFIFINLFINLFRTVTQTHEYLMFFLSFLFSTGLFEQYSYVKIWSDGCSKHFKTYPTHYYIATLQEKVKIYLIPYYKNLLYLIVIYFFILIFCSTKRKFLGTFFPRDAHNRADAAAAHFSTQITKAIRATCLLMK